jgi:hypothetical protein
MTGSSSRISSTAFWRGISSRRSTRIRWRYWSSTIAESRNAILPFTVLALAPNVRGHRPALDAAIAKLASLPADEQDRIAQWLLDELRDDEHWARQFATSQDALSKLAAEARAERSAGRATELDPDKL